MSWEEYKKKRKQESSWGKYKQQRDYERQQKEKAQIEQNRLLEKINLPVKEINRNQTVVTPNTDSKNNHMTNVRNSMATSLSQQFSKATTTKNKGIITSTDDIINRIKADEKNKNIAKGGVDSFNEYMDSTLNAIPGGTMSVFSGIANAGTSLAGAGIKGLQNLTNNENVEEKLQETYDKIINIGKDIHQKGNSTNLVNSYVDNNFTRESSNLVHTVSSQLTTYGLSLLTGIPAPVIQGTYVGGSSAQEVLNENKDNAGKAVLTGVGKGLTSYGVEKLTGGNILGKGSFDDGAVKFIAENFKSKTGQKIASKIYEVGGEVVEENLENAIDMVIDNVVNKKGYTVKDWWNELGETSKGTILATIALNLLGLGGDTYNKVQEYKLDSQAKKMIKEAETLIEKENLKIDFDKIKQNNQNTDTKLPLQSTQNVQNTPSQQVMPMQQENVQKTNMKTNQMLPMQNYVYEKSDNVKVDKFRQSASQNFDNSIESRNYLNMLEKIITDKDVDIIFDANLKDSQGRIANGSYSNGVITINPNSNRAGEFIAIHELTHAIGTNQMRNIVKQYRKRNTEFNSAVEQLLKNYNSTELTEEAMADVSAQLFGNQEFINNLAEREPSLFRKIYNEIKYLWHQFTGYKNQNQFIEDLQYKWEQAYRNNNKLNETTNYLLSEKAVDDVYSVIKETRVEAEKNTEQFVKLKDNTIKILVDYGIADYPMVARRGHVRENILTAEQAKELGYSIKNKHFHGVGAETYLNIIDSMDEPLGVYQYTEKGKYNENNFIVLTPVKINGVNAIVPVEINQRGQVNNVEIDINRIKSVYSKNNNDYIKNLLKEGKIKEIFNGSNSRQTSLINNSIPPSNENVNTTKYSMQESENNSGSFNLPKLKEGYTRLYRGLENEYDANYDKSKLDNSNGYESWTDNYELAKAYGDNVYYIDVPSSEVKNSIIDEDSQSETYGDRNLLYKNDKPVGIKGKSGNEYMLYTDHDNYGNIKYNKVNGNNFAQDNQGRTLSKKQKNILYHGTNSNIDGNYNTDAGRKENNAFGEAIYLTLDKEYAKKYGDIIYENTIKDDANIVDITSQVSISTEQLDKITNLLNKNGIEAINNGEYILTNKYGIIDPLNSNIYKLVIQTIKKVDKTKIKDVMLELGIDGIKNNNTYAIYNNDIIENNTKPTDNPDIRYSLPTKEWQQYLDENYKPTGTRTNLEDIRLPVKENSEKSSFNLPTNKNEIATILEKPAGKVKEKDRSWAIIKANLIDKGMVFEELSRKTGNRELQGKWDATLTATARGQNAIGNVRYELDPKTKTQKQISKSLTDIIDEVGENTADFYSYMYHQLNIDRMTLEERFGGDTGINYERRNPIMNKPVFGDSVTAKMSIQKVAELEKKHPEFKEYAQDVYDYLDANTKELVDNGVISKETQQLFKDMYPHYVPISRARNKGQAINVPLDTGRTGINSPIKKATGGSSDINPLFETMADRTLQTYRASARNSFGVELKNTLGKTNQILEKTDVDIIMENMTDEEQNKQLLQEGKNGENPTFTVFENGNKVTYEITKDMYDALKPKNELLSKIDENKASKMANKINNFRRGLLTEYNPVFSITNAIKDSQDILLNSQHSAKTYAKIPEATAQLLSKGYWYNEYIQNGGTQNSYFKDGEFETTKNNLPTKIKNTITFPLRAISNVNNVIEMTPRLAEYIVSREQGKSIETSMLDAARVTTNFKAGGDITKTLNRNGFTFLNASVQGLQQQIRNIQEAHTKGLKGYAVLACKYAIAGVPVLLLNNLIWEDDDEYEDLQDYVKDNYYIIGKLQNGKFLRIPKGRAVATIQKIVSNVNDFIKNDSINSDEVGKVFWEDMKENIQFGIKNLAPNNPMENNILSPIFQAITNKTWYGEDLVPTRLQNKPKAEQYDETTDKFSIWLGGKLNMSPYKINYVLDQYSGGAGDVLLPLGTPQAENNVIEDKFTTDATMKSKYPGEFFTKVDELEINSNSSKATDEDILKYKYISSVSSDIGKLYTKKREIQNSAATDKEKKEQLKAVQKQINDLAKNSLDKVEKITKGEKYAQIDTKQYYKDIEGEWKSVSKKDVEKNKKSGLSLKTYSSYKHEMSKVKQEKVRKGEMTEEQSLKDNEQIQILLDSNYSDKEKSIIYENYIKSSVKNGEYDSFKVIKASGININEYLKYKQQEFSSDKTDDGTLVGKTVSKSKQKKVVEYLNSMNIKGNQRLLLYAMQGYSMTSAQKTQLANYVNGLKIDKNTKLKLYDKFSGFTVYKDGTIKY